MAANKGLRVDAMYIDFARAFDSVCHSKLLTKLKAYGVDYELLNWIKAFVSDRTQVVSIGDVASEPVRVISGVPQGSVLGPILFVIYINDIVKCIEGSCRVKLFADDSKFYQSRKGNDNSDLVNTLENFCTWAKTWQLNVAFQKCNMFSVGNMSVPEKEYYLSSKKIYPVEEIRDLGIIISKNLKAPSHCSAIATKAYSRAALILRCFKTKNPFLLLRAYKTYVRPILESCTQVWNPHLKKDIIKIEKVQNFFTRMMCFKCNVSYRNYADRLKYFYMESLETRRIKMDITMVFKIINNLVDLKFDDFFVFENTKYNLRDNALKLKNIDKYKLDCRKYFFSNRVLAVWNSLPNEIVTAKSLYKFKKIFDNCDLSNFCAVF